MCTAVIVIHTHMYVYIYIIFQILLHYSLLQDTKYGSLRYILAPPKF